MGLEFALSLKSDVTFLSTLWERTDKVRAREMGLQRLIIIIEHVPEILAAQMTSQVHLVQMLTKHAVIEEIFLAEIAPWVRQDLRVVRTSWVAVLDVSS